MADYEVTFAADLSPLIANLSNIDGITEKEFKQATKNIERQFKNAANAAKKLRDSLKTDLGKRGKEAFQSLKDGAEAFGGQIGGAVAMVEKFGKSIAMAGASGGVLAGSAVAGAAAIGGLAFVAVRAGEAALDAARGAREWVKELDELGASVAPEASAAILTLNTDLDALSIVGKQVGVIFGGDISAGLADVTRLGVTAAVAFRMLYERSAELRAGIMGVAKGVLESLIPGLRQVNQINDVFGDGQSVAAQATEWLTSSLEGLDDEVNKVLGSTKNLTKARAEDNQKAIDQEEINKRAAEQWLKLREERQKFSDDIVRMAEDEASASIDATRRAWDEKSRAIQMEMDAARKLQEFRRQVVDSELAAIESLSSTIVANAEDRIANGEKLSAKEYSQVRKRANVAFAASQAAAVTQIGIDAARSVLAMTAFLAGFTGPAAPGIAAGIVLPVAAAQTAAVLSRKPPSFPTGGRVGDKVDGDHVMISAQRNEGVLTGRGMEAVGGASGLARINSGMSQPVTVQVMLPGSVMAQAIVSDRDVRKAVLTVVRQDLRTKG